MEPASSIALGSVTSSVRPDASDLKGPAAIQSSGRVQSNSAQVSKQEKPVSESASQSPQLPTDEVHVQRDTENDGKIVIRYVDHSGNLILQVPSEQLLALARAVGEALAQKPEAADATPAKQIEGQKEVRHGNQS